MNLASLLGWLAAFGIVVVIACRFVATRRHAGSTAVLQTFRKGFSA
jgi:HAMP domain-containing protein